MPGFWAGIWAGVTHQVTCPYCKRSQRVGRQTLPCEIPCRFCRRMMPIPARATARPAKPR